MILHRLIVLTLLAVALSLNPLCFAELGSAAPPLRVAQWVKGSPVDIAAGKGKTVYVVEFWATWCAPCRVTIPHLTELQKKYKDKNVGVIGMAGYGRGAATEDLEAVKGFVAKMGDKMDYSVGFDDNSSTMRAYSKLVDLSGFPTAVLINKEGVIVWSGHPLGGLDTALEKVVAGEFDIEAEKRARRAAARVPEYFSTLIESKDAKKAAEIGATILADAAGAPEVLGEFAWRILTLSDSSKRDLELAMRVARKAYEVTGGKSFGILDTYALALFESGKIAEAVKYETEAIEKCSDPRFKEELKRNLKKYEDKAAPREGPAAPKEGQAAQDGKAATPAK